MELKFISEYKNEIFFSYRNKKYIGIPFELSLASEFWSSGIYQLHQVIIEGKLPKNLEGVFIEYHFEEKSYHMKWICYFNSQPSESDEEIMSDIFGYVLADMPNISNKDIAFHTEEKYLHQPIPELITNFKDWIFFKSN